MPSITVKNARKAAKDYIETARERIASAGEKADEIRGSDVYTPEGKEEIAGGWAAEARKAAASAVERARIRAGEARRKSEGKLADALTVSESERATAAATLLPVITAAATDPTVLVRAYERRAADSLPDRIILEETIQASLDAGLGDVGFIEEWNRARNALDVQSDEERAALEDLAAVEGLESYIGAAETLLEGDLSGIETGAGAQFTVSVETARHTVATYEKALEDGTLDADAPTVQQAADVLEAAEFEPQEIPEAVRLDTEARRAALGA